jgi:hypothetical protein
MTPRSSPAASTAPFGFDSTAAEVVEGLDLSTTLEQGAATSVFVAVSPQLEGVSGRYFADCEEAPVVEPGAAGGRGFGVAAYAIDPDNARRLWDLSLRLLGH